MFLGLDGTVYDYFDGQTDLKVVFLTLIPWRKKIEKKCLKNIWKKKFKFF